MKIKNKSEYFEAHFNAEKMGKKKRKREKDSNHSNEGLSLLGTGVVCPDSLFLAPC